MASEEAKRMAAYAIERMFKGNCFYISTVTEAAQLLGFEVSRGEAYQKLRVLHCVDWAAMPRDIFAMVPTWIAEVLGSERHDIRSIPQLWEGNNYLLGVEDPSRLLPRRG